jgi:hypothetical protein
MRTYGRDIREDLWGENAIGVRRLSSMVENLPHDSAFIRTITHDWTTDRELAAAQIEVTHSLLRAFISANTKPGSRLPDPLQIPRPGGTLTERKPRGTTMRELLKIVGTNVEREG